MFFTLILFLHPAVPINEIHTFLDNKNNNDNNANSHQQKDCINSKVLNIRIQGLSIFTIMTEPLPCEESVHASLCPQYNP